MSTGSERLTLPARTVTRVQEWLRQKQELQAMIDATLLASREALNVPDEWLIRDITEGFVAPPVGARPDPEENGAREAVGVPEGYVLRDVAEGFVAPAPADAQSEKVMEPVG